MYSYITEELPQLIEAHFPVSTTKRSITGFSMGGHGALTIALRNPQRYKSVSAFAPITNPTKSWGVKGFEKFLGSAEAGTHFDATNLVA